VKLGPQHIFLLNHPDYIKDVLVTHQRNFVKGRALQRAKRLLGEGLLTSEGDYHQRQRRLVQPAFHRQRVAGYGAVMVDYAARQGDRWQDGASLDVAHEMMQLTLAIVGKTLFDTDVESEADDIGDALTELIHMFSLLTLPFMDLMERLPLPSVRRFQRAKARLDSTIYSLLEARRSSGEDRGDLVSMLLLAQDAEGPGGGMSNTQARDEALTIFLAGHETTANALTWTWYLLSQHPEIEQQFHAELDSVLQGRKPTVDDLPQLRYTRMVLSESMRLYPPAWVIGRRALQPYEVGGYVVPANALVMMSQYVMHRDPRYYKQPEHFNPQRWADDAHTERPKFAYFPFGGGPRLCIGESFAWMEGVLLLATIGQHWRMRLVPGHPVAPEPLITLRPKHGMRMTVERRSANR
jgi:cytochrome P450